MSADTLEFGDAIVTLAPARCHTHDGTVTIPAGERGTFECFEADGARVRVQLRGHWSVPYLVSEVARPIDAAGVGR